MEKVLRIENLSKSYQDAGRALTVIENLSYDFPDQGSVAIVGRSGVGKSTLLHILGGLDKPNSGSVLHLGSAIEKLDERQLSTFRAKNIGFVFQFHHLLGEFDALENVSMPLLILGHTEASAQQLAKSILERVGLAQRLRHRPAALSGGEQQRVALARALVTKPKVLLADEPTGNLDPVTAAEIQSLLLEINRELGNLMIIVTHSLDLASKMDFRLELQGASRIK